MAVGKLHTPVKISSKMKFIITFIAVFMLITDNVMSQDTTAIPTYEKQQADSGKYSTRIPMLTGNGFINFEKGINEGTPVFHGALYPIIVWKISSRLFFEQETEIAIEDQKIKADVEYATLHYTINRYFTIGAGKFLSPFGTYQERIHPAWINKFSEAPLGLSHDGILVGAMSEIGVEIRGGSPVGSSKLNYVAYISNGPALGIDENNNQRARHDSSDALMSVMLENGKLKDNNNNKAVGGRIGFLPFSNSSLEIGISNQYAKVGNKDDSLFSKAKVAMHAFDLSYVKSIPYLKGILDFKGQFNQVTLDKTDTSSSVNMSSMNNSASVSQAYFIQCSFRPALLQKKIIPKCEVVGRYSAVNVSEPGMPYINTNQFAVGFNYWLSWRSVIKIAYQISVEEDKHNESAFFVQLAIGNPRLKFKSKKVKE